jgi:hypothetical protein
MFKRFIALEANCEIEQRRQSSIQAELREEKFTMTFMPLHKIYVKDCYEK